VQAADLGIRLCQANARSVYSAFALVAIPTMTVAIAASEINAALPALLIWWAAPWFDRTILFVLSRAAFGQSTSPSDVWREQRNVWWRHIWFTFLVRVLSPWRPVTEPVYLLEGLPLGSSAERVRQIRRRQMGPGMVLTAAFFFAQMALIFALMSLGVWLAPRGFADAALSFVGTGATAQRWLAPIFYAVTLLFIEPFYVAAGFGMYLNRRAELEGWDIEQEFRRAFAA
jgi:hypothetical protein